jgi:hypothetical protein
VDRRTIASKWRECGGPSKLCKYNHFFFSTFPFSKAHGLQIKSDERSKGNSIEASINDASITELYPC